MTKIDYSKGKIYKIVCNKTGLCYIGSTCRTLDKRLKEHKYEYERYINKKTNSFASSIYVLFNNDYRIELVLDFPCLNKTELIQKEYYYMNTVECVNSKREKDTSAYRTEYTERINSVVKLIVDKCGNDIINILFREGIEQYKKYKTF